MTSAGLPAERIEWLQRMPIFGAISAASLAFLLDQAEVRDIPEGGIFCREGDPGACMFVLESGRVAVLKSWQGADILLHHLGPGDCFGEMALMDLSPRSASVVAQTECRAIELTSANLARLVEHDLEQFTLIQMNIGREVCRRLRATDALLFRLRMGEGLDALPVHAPHGESGQAMS